MTCKSGPPPKGREKSNYVPRATTSIETLETLAAPPGWKSWNTVSETMIWLLLHFDVEHLEGKKRTHRQSSVSVHPHQHQHQ